ncbi:MAG: nitroreductase family deazaflavin-dependent oxidoreductase [Streptosporangiales bacterium]|nr:nitroreductase family deazaflavin-dependent oxidoreductase [Streptosporangiales bacterium]
MARTYRLGVLRRAANVFMRAFVRLGLGPRSTHLLTVVGRKSGVPRTTPVDLVEEGGRRWLVAPYGAVGWVHNVRAAGKVTLRRGRRVETVGVVEVGATESAPILRRYLTKVAIVRPFFDVEPDSPDEDFVAEASRHPVFRITEAAVD